MAKRNMTSAELKQLRREVVINSLDVSDYRNTLNIDAEKDKTLFDRYIETSSSMPWRTESIYQVLICMT